jgi:pimeloyl-ACP methyl ester carboxylesterase
VVAQGIPFQGAIVKFASVLEKALPTKGKIISRVALNQAIRYINDEALAAAVDRDVRKQIFDGKPDPVIVVSHSLGTVVSYRLLADDKQAQRNVPLFVTLGSPLSVRMFHSILPPRGAIPTPPIGSWLNARNAEDFVTLGRPIDKDSAGFDGVIDHPDVKSDELNVHDVREYLCDPVVARTIFDALV